MLVSCALLQEGLMLTSPTKIYFNFRNVLKKIFSLHQPVAISVYSSQCVYMSSPPHAINCEVLLPSAILSPSLPSSISLAFSLTPYPPKKNIPFFFKECSKVVKWIFLKSACFFMFVWYRCYCLNMSRDQGVSYAFKKITDNHNYTLTVPTQYSLYEVDIAMQWHHYIGSTSQMELIWLQAKTTLYAMLIWMQVKQSFLDIC